MPYYRKQHILLIHIPKTGGSTIHHCLLKHNQDNQETTETTETTETVELLNGDRNYNKVLPAPFNRVSLQHQFYTTLYKYRELLNISFDENLKIITCVRNPYQRLVSDLFFYGIIKPNTTPVLVYRFLIQSYFRSTKYDNHNFPQYRFVTNEQGQLIPNIIIMKTETLDTDLLKHLGIEIHVEDRVCVGKATNLDYMRYLNHDSIRLINRVYAKDFQLFGYEMKHV